MQRDLGPNKSEDIKITFFEHTPPTQVVLGETIVQIPLMSGPIVRMAMLRGINDVFYKGLMENTDDMFPPEIMQEIEKVLEGYRQRRAAARAPQIIMPDGSAPRPPGASGLILPK
jgi:hypothetical protein